MRSILTIASTVVCLFFCAAAMQEDQKLIFSSDFQKDEPGSVPKDIKVTLGTFAIKEEGANRFLELATYPLDSLGLLIGPEGGADISLSAKMKGWTTGKRFPEFGIGMGGVGGYRLWLMPSVDELQITRNREVLAKVPFSWKAGAWTNMRMTVEKSADGRWLIAGKVWMDGDVPPAEWTIRYEAQKEPSSGRSSLWGTPYSEKPIQFDDVRVESR